MLICSRRVRPIVVHLGGEFSVFFFHNLSAFLFGLFFVIYRVCKLSRTLQNALLEFGRVVKAKEQVVAGKIYHLTLEATDAGKRKIYEAKVWVKPWINFKQLQEFKHAHDGPSFTSADLGVKRGWQKVPTFDQVIQRAALHAVKTIQQRSNSLLPYQLLDILLAEAEVIEDSTKFSMLLKVLRESKEEKFKVIVTKYIEGKFYVNQMEQGHS
ncbi:cysteine proteinase inhibitor 12-like isoform X2 [Diospyros lotus]|uniref:cysteine proteinase inhibitor 12-like isoform X2 n=1 Tax=Diospyros lotus TaxID=55363 RepID=UPI00225AFF78|nr:cysteine proteinase inhibitor 12-like isoform X2 [Diospyros lotus]